jgi:hypothetical protein
MFAAPQISWVSQPCLPQLLRFICENVRSWGHMNCVSWYLIIIIAILTLTHNARWLLGLLPPIVDGCRPNAPLTYSSRLLCLHWPPYRYSHMFWFIYEEPCCPNLCVFVPSVTVMMLVIAGILVVLNNPYMGALGEAVG